MIESNCRLHGAEGSWKPIAEVLTLALTLTLYLTLTLFLALTLINPAPAPTTSPYHLTLPPLPLPPSPYPPHPPQRCLGYSHVSTLLDAYDPYAARPP